MDTQKKKEFLFLLGIFILLGSDNVLADQVEDGLEAAQIWLSATLGLGCAILGFSWGCFSFFGGNPENGDRIWKGAAIGTVGLAVAPFLIPEVWSWFF